MRVMMRRSLLIVLLLMPLLSSAGIRWVEVGVDGLTCSMCSRSVEMSIKRLYFVDSVAMSLETTDGKVYLKAGQPVDLKKIARAITDAGFSVRFVRIHLDFDDVTLGSDGSFVYQGQQFAWVDYKVPASGSATLQLLDDGFLPRKESTEWKKKLKPAGDSGGKKVFHVAQL